MLLKDLENKKLIHPPSWLVQNTCYLTIMGSQAYATNIAENTDMDLYGFCIPLKVDVFPHLKNELVGFGRQTQRFNQFQAHHVFDEHAKAGKGQEYDITVYSIVRYFQLLIENNPNIIDSIFTPRNCVICSTPIAEIVRTNRKLFLHKGLYHKMMGYSFSQLHKINSKNPEEDSKRAAIREKFGWDTKYGMHLCRLVLQCEQLLTEGDLDLQRNSDLLRYVRNGNWSKEQLIEWFNNKEKILANLYHESKVLPHTPDEEKIKTLLLQCLEQHYGNCIQIENKAEQVLRDIKEIISKAGI